MNTSIIIPARNVFFESITNPNQPKTKVLASIYKKYNQDQNLSNFLNTKVNVTQREINKFCSKNKIKLENCGRLSLRQAMLHHNHDLIKKIIKASKKKLELSYEGYNSLLAVIVEGAVAYPVVAQLIAYGANVNCAFHEKVNDFFGKTITPQATPLYIAAEITKHMPTIHLLRKKGAICYPGYTEEGKKLVAKVDWLYFSGLLFYSAAHPKDSFFIINLVPKEIKNMILDFCLKIFNKE